MSAPRKQAHGAAMAELGLIIPVILLLIAGGIELTRAFNFRTSLLSLSREIASQAFRNCIGYRNPGDASTCLAGVIGAASPTWLTLNRLFPQATVRLRTVRYEIRNPGVSWPNNPVYWSRVGEATRGPTQPSRLGEIDANGNSLEMDAFFPQAQLVNLPRHTSLLRNQEYVLFAELYFPYTPLVPYLARLFGYEGGLFYVRLLY